MPRGFTDREKEIIISRLLEEGNKQFSTLGLKKTSVEDLAAAAGISKGAFYLFFDSKEALFMDVVEQVEERMRGEILALVDRPGATPRARLFAVLSEAIIRMKEIPLLRFMTGSDYDLVFRRLPPEKFVGHLESDRVFLRTLIERCRAAGILIQVDEAELRRVMYGIVLQVLHEQDFGPGTLEDSIEILIELVAAYCLGEIELQNQAARSPAYQEKDHL